jgi:hypothetical protein
MTPEGRVKSAVKRLLKTYDKMYYFMPVPGGYGVSTVDFICCYRGVFFAIETKAPGQHPTPRQELILQSIRWADGKTFVINGSDAIMELKEWLDGVSRQPET